MPFVARDGVRIRYEVDGSGPPLVLHPGFNGSLEDWYEAGYVAALRDTYRLILLDPRGQGQSDKPYEVAAYTWRERIDDVLAVLDELGIEQAHFWGYSMGGRVGFDLGAHAQERVSTLILGGASPYTRVQPVEEHPLFQGLQLGMATLVPEFGQGDPNYWISTGERERWLAADSEALSAALRAGFSTPDVDELSSIQTPALLYRGTHDDPDVAARAAEAMPNAAFVALDGLDHAAGFMRSDLVLPHVTAFLAQV